MCLLGTASLFQILILPWLLTHCFDLQLEKVNYFVQDSLHMFAYVDCSMRRTGNGKIWKLLQKKSMAIYVWICSHPLSTSLSHRKQRRITSVLLYTNSWQENESKYRWRFLTKSIYCYHVFIRGLEASGSLVCPYIINTYVNKE